MVNKVAWTNDVAKSFSKMLNVFYVPDYTRHGVKVVNNQE